MAFFFWLRLLAVFCLLACFPACADTLSVTPGGSGNPSTLNSPTFYDYSNTNFIYWFPTLTTNPGIPEIGGAKLDSSNTYPPLQVSFVVSNCASFEWESQNVTYGTEQVEASDGTNNFFSSVSPAAPGGSPEWWIYPNSSPTLYRVDLPYSTNWCITIFLAALDGSSGLFAGVNLPAGAAFLPTNAFPAQRTMVVFGDSYVKGYVPDDFSMWLNGFAMDLQQMGSNIKIFPSGVGGQGYCNQYDSPPIYQDRLTNDMFNLAPQFVLVTGSINDYGLDTNDLYNAALLLYGTIISNLPNANIAVIGTWYAWPVPTADDIGRDAMQQAAAAYWGLNYASPVQELWGQGGVGADGVHPNTGQYLNYANDISAKMQAWYGTNWIYSPASALTLPSIPPPQFLSAAPGNGMFTCTWSAVIGQNYQVQYSTDLTTTNWMNLGSSFTATSSTITNTDSFTASCARFYRVILLW